MIKGLHTAPAARLRLNYKTEIALEVYSWIDPPGMFDSIETWERYLKRMEAVPNDALELRPQGQGSETTNDLFGCDNLHPVSGRRQLGLLALPLHPLRPKVRAKSAS